MPTLRFFHKDQILFEHHVRLSAVRIGRADSCDISLPGEGISRQHMKIFSSQRFMEYRRHIQARNKGQWKTRTKEVLSYNDSIGNSTVSN